nr:unnamed protein product [Callosobruchus chinensis]
MESYINELKRYNTKVVFRVCDPTYDVRPLKNAGIKVSKLLKLIKSYNRNDYMMKGVT